MVGGIAEYETNPAAVGREVWAYNSSNDIWTQQNNLPDTLWRGIYAAANNTGYVGLGCAVMNGYDANKFSNRLWKLSLVNGIPEVTAKNNITVVIACNKMTRFIFPEAVSGSAIIHNMNGQAVASQSISSTNELLFNLGELPAGAYIFSYSSNTETSSRTFVLSE